MSIEVKCRCGHGFSVIEEYAGTKVRCDQCRALIEVRSPRPMVEKGAGYGVETVRKCPVCKKEWPEEAAICTRCGYDFRTGKRRETTYDRVTRSWSSPPNWAGLTLHLTFVRDEKGYSTLILRRRWLALVPLGSRTLYLEDYDTLLTDCALGIDTPEAQSLDFYRLYVENRHRQQVRVFHCYDEFWMREVAEELQELGRLKLKRR